MIHDAAALVVCTDFHVVKALARALVFVTERPVSVRCGHREAKIVDDRDLEPLSRLRREQGKVMGWIHNICSDCWTRQEGDRTPVTVIQTTADVCCWCGRHNSNGIYKRADPSKTPCEGVHVEGLD